MDQALMERGTRDRTTRHRTAHGNDRAGTQLRLRIQHALEQSGYHQLRELGVRVEGGEVALRGELPTWYLTQLALTRTMRVEGVGRVRNEIQVTDQVH